MLRIVAKQVCRSRQIMSTTKPTFRQFSGEKFTIPSDKELQTGRRKDELDAEERGEVGFNLHPIVPPNNAGTKANPIRVNK